MKDLFIACETGDIYTVKNFINNGINVNFTHKQVSLLYYSAVHGQNDIAKFLRSKGAVIQKTEHGNTPLHAAVRFGHYETCKLFMSCINCVNNMLQTPLHIACQYKQTNIIKLLLDNGSDINGSDIKGHRPLLYACINNDIDSLKLIMTYKPELNFKVNNKSCLDFACSRNYDLAEFLILNGEIINNRTIEHSYNKKRYRIVKLLMSHSQNFLNINIFQHYSVN